MTALRGTLRATAQQLLLGANTIAGPRIYTTRDLPISRGTAAAVLIYTPQETSTEASLAGVPRFKMKLGMVFECITASAGLAAAEGDLETLTEQVLDGLLCNPAFTALTDANGNRLVEGFTELEIIERFDGSSDRHIGTAHIGLGVQYHQVFNPVLTTPLEEITLTTTDEFLSADLVFPQN